MMKLRLALAKMTAAMVAGIFAMSIAQFASAETLSENAAKDGVRVAYFNFAPFAYANENGEVIGESVEILEHVLNEMGLEISDRISTDWGALIPGLKAGRFDSSPLECSSRLSVVARSSSRSRPLGSSRPS